MPWHAVLELFSCRLASQGAAAKASVTGPLWRHQKHQMSWGDLVWTKKCFWCFEFQLALWTAVDVLGVSAASGQGVLLAVLPLFECEWQSGFHWIKITKHGYCTGLSSAGRAGQLLPPSRGGKICCSLPPPSLSMTELFWSGFISIAFFPPPWIPLGGLALQPLLQLGHLLNFSFYLVFPEDVVSLITSSTVSGWNWSTG